MGRGKLPSQSGRQSRPCQPGGNYKYGRGQFRNQRYERRSGYFTPGWRQKHSRGSPPPDGRTRPALRHSGPLCVRLAVLDQDSSGADLRYPDRHGHGPNCPPRSLPHHVDLRRSGAGPSSVGDHQRRGAQAEGVREDYPAGLPFEHRRRIRQAESRLPQPGGRVDDFNLGNLSCPAVSVQQRDQAVPGFRGSALRRRRRDHRALDHAYLIWIHGLFLGIASLIGVIVSHVIVLFDFIEEMHAQGEPFEEAVIDAGIIRLRPVMITVGATVLALFPLALPGGPLWQPLCYAQIGGLTVATFITLLMVPVFYSIFVLDLKILSWETKQDISGSAMPVPANPSTATATSGD